MKSKKITISLMLFFIFVFGIIFSIIGLIFFTSKHKQSNNDQKYTRFSLKNKINEDKIHAGIINALIDKESSLNKDRIVFKNTDNINEIEIFFKDYLKIIFNLNNDYNTKLNIHNLNIQDYNISFSISWYFEHKNTYIIYKNTKYYDMLKLIYKGFKNESKNY